MHLAEPSNFKTGYIFISIPYAREINKNANENIVEKAMHRSLEECEWTEVPLPFDRFISHFGRDGVK